MTFSIENKLSASFEPYSLDFKNPSGTSRGVLTQKKGYILKIKDNAGIVGMGECSIIPGLSPDYKSSEQYEHILNTLCEQINDYAYSLKTLNPYPSIKFGVESALLDLQNGGKQIYFSSGEKPFSIPINGLVWMGDIDFMKTQIQTKIAEGFQVIKLKIGALDFESELALLQEIRKQYKPNEIIIRVDANGAFSIEEAESRLMKLAGLGIHSIEQPIKAGKWNEMSSLCSKNIIPIALDEELIGIHETVEKACLLDCINPQYIILKPSLHGGISGVREWIQLAEDRNIGWWMTSALESNIGLNVIAQFTATFSPTLAQGLGTGALYKTNFEAPLSIKEGYLHYSK